MDKQTYGLVLGGGGTRAFAHLGVIAALYDHGIKPDIISGTSAGAITGAFIAAGKDPREVMKIVKKGSFFTYTKIHLPMDGFFKLDGLKELITSQIKEKRIEELPTPLYVCVSNLNSGKAEYVHEGNLAEFILASSSIPLIFSPVNINGNQYVDGGIMDNLPLHAVKGKCDKIIVSNISPVFYKKEVKNLIQVAARTMYMSVNVNISQIKKQTALYIEPIKSDKHDLFSVNNAEELFECGYSEAEKVIKAHELT